MRPFSRRAAWTCVLAVAALVAGLGPAVARGAASAQDPAIAVLKSGAPVEEKSLACRQLKVIGTAEAVPALAALLADKDLSHMARYALETMPFPEASAALRDALPKVPDDLKVGLINSIGERRDRQATAALAALASAPRAPVAAAAAAALGKIGTPEAAKALAAARASAPKALEREFLDAVLRCADRLLAAGDAAGALALYRDLQKPAEPPHVRRAGLRGLVMAGGDQALPALADALAGSDPEIEAEAAQIARAAPGAETTRMLAALLPKLPPDRQVKVLGALAERADTAAAPAVAAQAKAADPAVRLAALKALATVGQASSVALLVEAAATGAGAARDAARDALDRIPGADADRAVLAQLDGAGPAARVEIARALAARRMASAVPTLLEMAGADDASVRLAAAASLGELAADETVGPMVRRLTGAATDADRDAVEKALSAVLGRSKRPEAAVGPVLAALKGAAGPVRCALLRVGGKAGGAEALGALRAGVRDSDPAVQDAALRTMAESSGQDAAADLLRLAREAPTLTHRVLALRGTWRLVGLAGDRPVEERWQRCRDAMAAAQRPEEKKLGLTGLAKVPHPDALKLAEGLAADEALRSEAQAACVGIAAALGATHPAEAKAALRRVLEAAKDENLRARAAKTLDEMDQYVGYVTPWQAAGPYREQGKSYQELFDVVFPPEQSPPGDVAWKPAPAPADPALFWQVDLASVVSGDQAVAYLRTRVYSPRRQTVRLDIGTDDGIKLWVNGKLVHSNNVARPVVPGQDKAEAVLAEGWNEFLAKITQNNQGCGACIRIRAADGAPVEGLRFDAGAAAGAGR